MSSIWTRGESGDWAESALAAGRRISVARRPGEELGGAATTDLERDAFVRVAGDPSGPTVLVCGRELNAWVNGLPVQVGLRVLSHRDEIRVDGFGAVHFSTDAPVRAEPFAGRPRPCARCTSPIEAGGLAVRCPGCFLWFHQRPEQSPAWECWTYDPACPQCGTSTTLGGGHVWTPLDQEDSEAL